MTTIDYKSLLRCTVKKSVHVFERVLVYAAYSVVACAVGAIGYLGATNILIPSVMYGTTVAVAFLVNIPWYYNAGTIVLLAIIGYSFLWCIARDLEKEDWESNAANSFAVAIAITFTVAFAAVAFAAFAFTFTVAFAAVAFAAIAIAFTVAFAAVAFAVDPVDRSITIWYYVFRFCGAAWHHYYARKK